MDTNWDISRVATSLLPFFWLGLFASFRRFKQRGPALIVITGTFAVSLVFWGYARFRLVMEPYVVLLCALDLDIAVCWVYANMTTLRAWSGKKTMAAGEQAIRPVGNRGIAGINPPLGSIVNTASRVARGFRSPDKG